MSANILSATDIQSRSHWLQQALPVDPGVEPPQAGRTRADVCIVGGGFLGLWTAIRLKEREPSLEVVMLERDICGGGPSGRNSGMLLPAWPKFGALRTLKGEVEGVEVVRRSLAAIGEIEAFCDANGIDAWFDRVGWIWGATCRAQTGAWNDALDRLRKLDCTPVRPVSREEIAHLIGSASYLEGVLDASAATVHPGFLVRGLRRVALELGVRIHERSPMTSFERGPRAVVRTRHGTIEAHTLILAMNAWSARVPELAPAIFNISSDDAASLPIPETLDAVGYRRGPLAIDSRVFVSGYRVTRDGRLIVGVTGGAIGFGGLVDGRFEAPSPRVEAMRQALRASHPALADFKLASAWNGPIDRTDRGLPLFGRFEKHPNILYGYGFSGNGIGMTYMGGHILSSLALGAGNWWTDCALVRPVRRGFPPEPLRFIGAHFVRGAVRRRDRLEHQDRRPGRLTSWLAGLAPSGVTPSKANVRAGGST